MTDDFTRAPRIASVKPVVSDRGGAVGLICYGEGGEILGRIDMNADEIGRFIQSLEIAAAAAAKKRGEMPRRGRHH